MDASRKKIAITFDDGPSRSATDRILTVLEENEAKASFFVVGNRVADHIDQLKRMAADGFQIGNHCWDHEYITDVPEEILRQVLTKTSQAIEEACGIVPRIMRPPGGFQSPESLKIVGDLGFPAIFWSVDPQDWRTRDSQATIDHVLANVKAGDIVIMHDLYDATAKAAEFLIPELIRQGWQLVTISELFEEQGGLIPGKKYFRLRTNG